jgi:hypothetical protein
MQSLCRGGNAETGFQESRDGGGEDRKFLRTKLATIAIQVYSVYHE